MHRPAHKRDLIELSHKHYAADGTRKPDHYFDVYAEHIGKYREGPIDLLELGVSSGASVLIWREFFPNANIVGLDIRAMPERIREPVERGQIHFIQGDQSSPDVLTQCLERSASGAFDVIIDDASHVGWLSRASFEWLFVNALRPGGVYFVEDYGTGYMADFFDGGPYNRPSYTPDDRKFPSHDRGMVGWMKQLIDDLHGPEILPPGSATFPIASIQYYPSIALVHKKPGPGSDARERDLVGRPNGLLNRWRRGMR
jgi:hypothetical protein